MPVRLGPRTLTVAAAVAFVSAAMLVWLAVGAKAAAPMLDLSGHWARPYIGFEPPLSGPGPIVNRSRIRGQSDINRFVGDYTNPILKPEAAEIVKKHGELEAKGLGAPNPSNQCLPMSPPYILQRQEIQVLQQKNQITLLYAEDQQVRRVRLNAQHPARVIPTWFGDSIGHYEGDTLVIDTIGIKVGQYSMVDSYGTPHSEALHVIERYRLIDYAAAEAAATSSERENRRLLADNVLGNGVGIDADYKGKALQVQFTVEDENIFTVPWSAISTYWHASGDWVERVCAENTNEYYAGLSTAIPRAQTPDF
jgi:hypothetical protein